MIYSYIKSANPPPLGYPHTDVTYHILISIIELFSWLQLIVSEEAVPLSGIQLSEGGVTRERGGLLLLIRNCWIKVQTRLRFRMSVKTETKGFRGGGRDPISLFWAASHISALFLKVWPPNTWIWSALTFW